MKTISIKMIPMPDSPGVSGINTVVRAYGRLADKYGIRFTAEGGDITLIHAGMGKKGQGEVDIAMLHGIYFTAEYNAPAWERAINQQVMDNILSATTVTVPSDWVAQTLRREFKIDPYILEHGVFYDDWQHNLTYNPKKIFWGKNRIFEDVCDPAALVSIARRMPDLDFITTLAPDDVSDNVHVMGLMQPDAIMRQVQESALVLSTIKETWGILYMEAMAAGTPVVAADIGHVPNLVRHGVAGYCYRSGNLDDLERGIRWTLKHRDVLSKNAQAIARYYTWDRAMIKLRQIIEHTINIREN